MLSIDCVVGKGLFKYKDKTGNKNQQFVQIIINLNWSCKITFLFLNYIFVCAREMNILFEK